MVLEKTLESPLDSKEIQPVYSEGKMGKEIINQVQETQRVPNRINPKQNTLRHISIKLTKSNTKNKY